MKSRGWLVLMAALAAVSCAQVQGPVAMADAVPMVEHYVPVVSRVPSMSGSVSQIYVRERADSRTRSRSDLDGQVVLFIHGAGTPAEVAFDVPVEGFSWMQYLAARGMDTFAMDMTGYGRSYRPVVMNDRCNLSADDQSDLFGDRCAPSYPYAITSMDSDWQDIDAVVNYIHQLRGVDKVHLVGWSQGGPRSAGYAARHPEKVGNMVLLAPAYRAEYPATLGEVDFSGTAMTKQSRADFDANWDRQVGCNNQYTRTVSDAVWLEMLASDPVGASWGTGVRRAPRAMTFGWGADVVKATQTPLLMVAGAQDKQVVPQMVRNLYADYGAQDKLFLEMPCASHNAMWEKDAQTLFDASYQWLTTTSWNGMRSGMHTAQ